MLIKRSDKFTFKIHIFNNLGNVGIKRETSVEETPGTKKLRAKGPLGMYNLL